VRYAQALVLRGQPQDAAEARRQLAVAAQEAAALGIAVPDGGTPLSPEPAVAACTRLGRGWQVQYGSHSVLVEHSVGLLHLAVLVANPGREIPAVELVAGITALAEARAAAGVSAQPVLDQVAAREYRRRLARLRAEIGELEISNDPDRVAIARAERDWLTAELAGATAFAGRTRRFPDDSERARIAAGKAIRRALARIEEADAVVGEHLRAAVHTGVRCSYRPGPRI
jgi:hypothetical protein